MRNPVLSISDFHELDNITKECIYKTVIMICAKYADDSISLAIRKTYLEVRTMGRTMGMISLKLINHIVRSDSGLVLHFRMKSKARREIRFS